MWKKERGPIYQGIYPDILRRELLVGWIYPKLPRGRMKIFCPFYPNILG
jgi:hypothetical protein